MKIDIDRLVKRLAGDLKLSDYDFWRATKTINQALYTIERNGEPIPIDILRARNIIRQASKRRKYVGRGSV